MLQRRQLRGEFEIKGSICEDFVLSCCCACCVLVQEEKQLDFQAERHGYRGPQHMTYPPDSNS